MGNRKHDGLEKTQREHTDNISMFYPKLGETQKRIKANVFNNDEEERRVDEKKETCGNRRSDRLIEQHSKFEKNKHAER